MTAPTGVDGKPGFPFGPYPSVSGCAGLHIRHGDKGVDGFRAHTLEAQLLAARKSSECESPTRTQLAGDSCKLKRTPAPDSGTTPTASAEKSPRKTMNFFVASDDKQVLAAAQAKGFLVTRGGVSQETLDRGMAATLEVRPDMSYNASLEIIADIYFLAHCTTLVGTASSQVFRVAVGVSTALGLLQSAVAVDFDQLPKIRRWSTSFLPLPEAFIDGRERKL